LISLARELRELGFPSSAITEAGRAVRIACASVGFGGSKPPRQVGIVVAIVGAAVREALVERADLENI
jgi:hypothetical protein